MMIITMMIITIIIVVTLFFPKTRGLLNFYSMSYLYFGAMATSSVVLVGVIVSYATGKKLLLCLENC